MGKKMAASHADTGAAVLPNKLGGGPHGLGDPFDRTLRKVEMEVLIPKKMRDKAKAEKCFEEVGAFSECCKSSSLAMAFTCRKENSALMNCLSQWYENEEFKKICRDEYLAERSEFRATGIKKLHRPNK